MSKFRYFSRFEKLEREESAAYSLNPRPRQTLEAERENDWSPASEMDYQSLPQAVIGRQTGGRKAASRAAAFDEERKPSQYIETDFADPSKRKLYREFRNAQLALEASRQNVSIRKAKVFSGPIGGEWPLTTSGTAARYSAQTSVAGRPRLQRQSALVPCVERYARRAALFALGKNRGWHTRKRKRSWIEC